ncbi:TPA: sugar phosphate isomerase/epimerase [Candidatus Bathyarchaeota archaeon]|nr:sugar phosphate isomerase/epimerase [Candidatus Bathyarchaeota archaeon]
MDLAVEFGCDIVSGPIYSAVGPTLEPPDKTAEWERAVKAIKEVASYAKDRGIYLGVEPINRYENHLVNTVAEAIKFVLDVDSPAVKLHVDTYHANIEEKSVGGALEECGELLYHVHACENDRGAPGSGHIEWKEVAKALKSIGYDRYLVIETFQPGIKEIAVAASIWRPLAKSQDELASEGLEFLKKLMG